MRTAHAGTPPGQWVNHAEHHPAAINKRHANRTAETDAVHRSAGQQDERLITAKVGRPKQPDRPDPKPIGDHQAGLQREWRGGEEPGRSAAAINAERAHQRDGICWVPRIHGCECGSGGDWAMHR